VGYWECLGSDGHAASARYDEAESICWEYGKSDDGPPELDGGDSHRHTGIHCESLSCSGGITDRV
jgi:hypothetical protein